MPNDDTSCTGVVGYGNISLPNGDCSADASIYCGDCDTSTDTSTGLRKVIFDWSNPTSRSSVAAKHGLIEDWDLSEVTNLKCIFYNLNDFNADISKWDTSAVTTMYGSTLNTFFGFVYS